MMNSKIFQQEASAQQQNYQTVIEAKKGWFSLDFKEIYRFRELLYFLAWRDIKARYKQSIIGAGWAVIQPFMSMVVFSIFFGGFMKVPSDGYPYPIFVYAGLLPWTFFASAVSTSGTSLVANMNLVSKVYFPKLILPASALAVAAVDFFIAFFIYFALMAFYAVVPGWNFFLLPFLIFATMVCALGTSMFLAALIVRFRDFRAALPFIVQIWMYATPVVFPTSIVPEKYQWIISLNPMAGIINGFRGVLLNKPIVWENLTISMTMCLLFFVAGLIYFKSMEDDFADLI